MPDTYPINIWINEERYEQLRKAGLADLAKDVLAGMKVLQVPCDAVQRDELLKRYPSAKFDSATTKSIELLPPDTKNQLFELVVEHSRVEIVSAFLKA
ncbi:hypothetical protein JW960_15445 [candidate division KSB1 bacterium]|nr:hypothetical protein [candidate division KSB1 bacterium]